MKHMIMIGISVAAFSAPIAAMERGMKGQASADSAQAQQQQQRLPKAQFQGQIAGVRTFEIGGEQHVLVKLTGQQGRTLVVDVGPQQMLQQQQIELKEGERLTGTGVPGRIGNNPVLVVTRLNAGGQQVQVRQMGRMQQRTARIQGEIVDTMQVQLEGVDQAHTLVKLRAGSDRIAVVDLGPEVPSQLALAQGQRLAVQGLPARISGQPVIVASRVMQPGPGQQQGQR